MKVGGGTILVTALALVAAAPVVPGTAHAPEAAETLAPAASACAAATAADSIRMTASRRARGARGMMVLRLAPTPFGVAVTSDGNYRYGLAVEVEGLRPGDGAYHVAWVATPQLDRHRRLGTLGDDGRVEGEVSWNKFLVFVTAEDRPNPSSWSQRILLSALSPSGRMHTMAGHGPFSGEPCLDPRN